MSGADMLHGLIDRMRIELVFRVEVSYPTRPAKRESL